MFISKRKYFIKMKLNSPGSICIFWENAFGFIKENWFSLLLLCNILFGGEITYDNFTLKMPSLKNFVNYVIMLKYDKEKKELENSIEKEKYYEINKKNAINDTYAEQEKIIDLLKDLCEIKEKIGVNTRQKKLYNELIETLLEKIKN